MIMKELSYPKVLTIAGSDSGGAAGFALIINSSEGNYDVSGGTITINNDDGSTHLINSRAPLWNLVLESDPNGGGYEIDEFDEVGTQTEDIPAQTLVILNDFTIDGAHSQIFTTNNNDVHIGGDFILEDGATYSHGTNTTKFIGDGNSDIIIDATIGSVTFNIIEIELKRLSDLANDISNYVKGRKCNI